jgi:type II secretory pathway predicted ATPase ExeA
MDQTAPFCLLLLGQPTLRRRLRQGTFTALDQRIAVRYAIAGLSATETASCWERIATGSASVSGAIVFTISPTSP